MMEKTMIAAVCLVVSAGAFAEVKATCNTKMNGEAKCEFMNTGPKKDSTCVVIEMVRAYSADTYSRPAYGGEGAALVSDKICSGLVEPQDIRERSPSGGWSINGTPMTPLAFCDSDNPWFKAATNCTITTKAVKN